jgi:hypothetical protein
MPGNYYVQNNTLCYGVVEDTNDPLKLGRAKVRVFGVHTDNLQEVPTADLPWASPIYPPNGSKMFSSLVEGDFVTVHFPDGDAAQVPIILGTAPAVKKALEDKTKGFSPQSANPIKTDKPNGLQIAGINIPTLGPAARGDVANTQANISNSVLTHSCDFRYFVTIPSFGALFVGLDPIAQLKEAINQGKNQAAQIMRSMLAQVNQQLRNVFNVLIPSLGLDPTGLLSRAYSIGKRIVREIKRVTKQIATYVATASLYYNLVKNITMIVDYLKSLPTKIKAMIQGCITQFLASIQNFVNSLKTIVGAVGSGIDNILNELGLSSQQTLDDLLKASNTSNTSANTTTTANTASAAANDTVSILVFNTDADHANLINNYITSNFANANVTFANATANSYNINNTQAP